MNNIVLVHGGFVEGSGWEGVYRKLTKDGYNVSIVQNPTLSLADDVAVTKRALASRGGPVILVGHSYGGAVITEAGNDPKVAGLVYITAFAPDKGESVATLIKDPPPGAPVPPIMPPQDGYLFLDRAKFPASFAADVDAEKAAFMADSQVPWGVVPEAQEAALEVVRDAKRAADIIDRFRSLYQKGSPQLDIVDVNELVKEMAIVLHNEAKRHSVAIRTDLAEGLPTVMADRVQLQQALMNLMLNGIEAMRDASGELSIKVQSAQDGQLLISVTDTGVGLPADNVDKIFDAFFTTKVQGTGLGLAITRSIIASHGGRIWATPNPGRGATFHFTLPNTVAAAA